MMTESALLRAVIEMDVLLSECIGLTLDGFEGHRLEMLQSRRSLTAQTAAILEIGLHQFAGRNSCGEFRVEHSKLRSAIALHQANWPISSYDAGDARYTESFQRMQSAYMVFMTWVRQNTVND